VSVASQPALVEPLRKWDPERVGGYVMLGRLGAGAMGQVYLGRSAAGRLVAIKMIKSELAEEPDFRTRFGQEIAAARRVSGAFTAAVVAADSEADVPWLATTYVPAPTLSQLVRRCGPLPVQTVRWLAAGCAEALEAIHSVGLVHRDLKPSNVLVSPDGPRVIDFGLARAAERIQLTITRGGAGTPAYMAPEQARDTRQATGASDVFSLGATVLFAATGHPPYRGRTVMDVLVRLATEPPDLSGLAPELTEIVTACLERQPRSRPSAVSIVSRLAAAGELESAPLPVAAFALIDEYRITPSLSSGPPASPGADSGAGQDSEPTLGSHLRHSGVPRQAAGSALSPRADEVWAGPAQAVPAQADEVWPDPAQAVPAQADEVWTSPARTDGGWTGPTRTAAAWTGADLGRNRRWLIAAAVAAGIAVLAGGWLVGAKLADNGTAPAPGYHQSGPGSLSPTGSADSPPSPSHTASPSGRDPTVTVSQPPVAGYALFIIHGQSWPPRTRLSITISVHGTSRKMPYGPLTSPSGSFSYSFNKGPRFSSGSIPVGPYTVRVTGPGGRHADVSFEVLPSGVVTAP
jgi:serine/threonine protein kinase